MSDDTATAVAEAERDALLAYLRSVDPDLRMEDILDDVLTDRHGNLVYRPANAPAPPAPEPTPEPVAETPPEPKVDSGRALRLLHQKAADTAASFDPDSLPMAEILDNRAATYEAAYQADLAAR